MTITQLPHPHPRSRAFSLVEVLVLVAVIGIVGAAAGRALQAVVATPVKNDRTFQIETQLISKLEYIRSLNFNGIMIGSPSSTLSDIVTISGANYQRIVNVSFADANGDGVADVDFKLVTVTIGDQSVSTYICR